MSRLPLPPPYLSINLPIMDIHKTPSSELTPTRLGFPNEFPYEFDSPTFSPDLTSPGDSTETEDESNDDEEDFLARLNRRLVPSTQRLPLPPFNSKSEEKLKVAATLPQSTLSGLGSFSNSGGRSPILQSPPASTTSFRRDNASDVILAAAGEVARLKLGTYAPHLPRQNPQPSLLRRQNAAFQADISLQQQRLFDQMWLCSSQSRIKIPANNHYPRRVVTEPVLFENPRCVRHNNALSNPSWLPTQQHAGTPLKRPSAGTGVFLPRRYPSNSPSDSQKQSVSTAAMLQQSKVNRQNLNYNEFTNFGSRRSHFDKECMFARRYLLALQGNFRSGNGGCLSQERQLPQDWMY